LNSATKGETQTEITDISLKRKTGFLTLFSLKCNEPPTYQERRDVLIKATLFSVL